MNFDDDQLLRIAEVIRKEPVFQKVFDKNLEGKVTDDEVIGHVIYFEKNKKLYGYSEPVLDFTGLKKAKAHLDEALEYRMDKVYGIPLITTKKKRTKKAVPVRTRKSKKRKVAVIDEEPYPKVDGFDEWLKEKEMYLSTKETYHGMSMTKQKNTYIFPDGTEMSETIMGGVVISRDINRPFITGVFS